MADNFSVAQRKAYRKYVTDFYAQWSAPGGGKQAGGKPMSIADWVIKRKIVPKRK